MSIKTLFFASLREQVGQSQVQSAWQTGLTAQQLWQQITQTEFPANVLVARNQEYCEADTLLSDGDEVAFFPPVTGG
ncbi:MAG: molybdopterin converting factor subunit 1 [Thiothrix sp.]|nr:MAG: molybdopterin converting factor subunit 1 [Thiothrix sp.]